MLLHIFCPFSNIHVSQKYFIVTITLCSTFITQTVLRDIPKYSLVYLLTSREHSHFHLVLVVICRYFTNVPLLFAMSAKKNPWYFLCTKSLCTFSMLHVIIYNIRFWFEKTPWLLRLIHTRELPSQVRRFIGSYNSHLILYYNMYWL